MANCRKGQGSQQPMVEEGHKEAVRCGRRTYRAGNGRARVEAHEDDVVVVVAASLRTGRRSPEGHKSYEENHTEPNSRHDC